jgi:hypothetical protein
MIGFVNPKLVILDKKTFKSYLELSEIGDYPYYSFTFYIPGRSDMVKSALQRAGIDLKHGHNIRIVNPPVPEGPDLMIIGITKANITALEPHIDFVHLKNPDALFLMEKMIIRNLPQNEIDKELGIFEKWAQKQKRSGEEELGR